MDRIVNLLKLIGFKYDKIKLSNLRFIEGEYNCMTFINKIDYLNGYRYTLTFDITSDQFGSERTIIVIRKTSHTFGISNSNMGNISTYLIYDDFLDDYIIDYIKIIENEFIDIIRNNKIELLIDHT